jgi:hypothetical protein
MESRKEKIFRLGLVTKGIVYLLVGALFITASRAGGTQSTLQFIADQPFGQILLALVGLGLLGYSAFRWYSAIEDPANEGDGKEGISKRVGYAASGSVYALLAVSAFSIILGRSGGGDKKTDMASQVMAMDYGYFLIAILGVILIGVGVYHLYKSWNEKYKEKVQTASMSRKTQKIYDLAAKSGLAARGVVFAILGYFLIKAAASQQAGKVGGLEEAFQFLQQSGFPWAASLIALGLAAYGVYMFVMARYRPL